MPRLLFDDLADDGRIGSLEHLTHRQGDDGSGRNGREAESREDE
jgi:hypothetical protein